MREGSPNVRFDVLVVGGGHAGCEAALAAARMGGTVALLTMDAGKVAAMPCNCSIGGPGKAQIVREVDALGGEMAINTDKAYTHIRMLNTKKGPAVRSLRAQVDKQLYQAEMLKTLLSQEGLTLLAGQAMAIVANGGRVTGVQTDTKETIHARSVVLTAGTFLRGTIWIGRESFEAGRAGERAASELSQSLRSLGVQTTRLKTGTVPRVEKGSLDFDRLGVQPSETRPLWFSFESCGPPRGGLLPCWVTRTTPETRRIILGNLSQSALYGGHIQGMGPRYCPSIEDKMVKFADQESHVVFLEQEGWNTDSIYVQGTSNSLPGWVQVGLIRSLPGLERAVLICPGYAIEYDAIDPSQLKPTLELKQIGGLFTAGQINGTSGYEEAAGQGILAGINAALQVRGCAPVVLQRTESYIGVMGDDLVTRGAAEPYRMFTARAEHRLLLRQDNADFRLSPLGRRVGLVSDSRWESFQRRVHAVAAEIERLHRTRVQGKTAVAALRDSSTSGHIEGTVSLADLLRRPDVSYDSLGRIDVGRTLLPENVIAEVETQIKYEGYINRQRAQVARVEGAGSRTIPQDLDFSVLPNLRKEAQQKLMRVRPRTVGQASRIPGVTSADVSALLVYIERERRSGAWAANVSRETNGRQQEVELPRPVEST